MAPLNGGILDALFLGRLARSDERHRDARTQAAAGQNGSLRAIGGKCAARSASEAPRGL